MLYIAVLVSVRVGPHQIGASIKTMELIEHNQLNALYAYILANNDYSDLLSMPLPREHMMPNHPSPFYPARAIVDFFAQDGHLLWQYIRDEDYRRIYDWSLVPGHELYIQHPLTGDTIFHADPSLADLFEADVNDHKLIMNWHGHNSVVFY